MYSRELLRIMVGSQQPTVFDTYSTLLNWVLMLSLKGLRFVMWMDACTALEWVYIGFLRTLLQLIRHAMKQNLEAHRLDYEGDSHAYEYALTE
jgi:hypothetical protein